MLSEAEWVTEVCDACGTAFSLRGAEQLAEVQSEFQKIEIYRTDTFGNLMLIDGFVMLTTRDNFLYHEMMSHPALFTHPAPRKVAIIGGGDCGTLREVLKHRDVVTATQVDIDEQVTRLAEQFFPELCESNDDPRASLLFADGIRWVADQEPGSLDLIIVDSTDPIGPAEGLFNEAFYRSCLNALGEDGILVQQSESPLLHMALLTSMRRAMTSAGFGSLHTLNFPQPVYPSGWWSATMAFKSQAPRPYRDRDVEAKTFDTRYYNAAIHAATLAVPTFMQEAFEAE